MEEGWEQSGAHVFYAIKNMEIDHSKNLVMPFDIQLID
jgi:hypothetical protein